jgi:hypothetical protein
MSSEQQERIDRMFSDEGVDSELLGPLCRSDDEFHSESYYPFLDQMGKAIEDRTGRTCFP